MKRIVKNTLAFCAASVIALALAAPGQAQQFKKRTAHTMSQQREQVYQPRDATEGYAAAPDGYDAYDYAPIRPGLDGESCTTQGDYGHPVDYGACGGD